MLAAAPKRYDAVLFDLLTALIDSWTLWDRVAGSASAGRRWRARYLELTFGCGAYQPYERLVAQAAGETGIPAEAARALEAQWKTLSPWEDARPLLESLRRTHRLGVVTNCSERLGREAAALLPVSWDVVVTAESAGVYKPDPRPYRLALDKLGLAPEKVLFVAGSGYDLIGTARVGLDTYWHNRVGLTPPPAAPAPLFESRTLAGVQGVLFPGKDTQ
jgi:2-haloalkanoic acid dehalogenase type II